MNNFHALIIPVLQYLHLLLSDGLQKMESSSNRATNERRISAVVFLNDLKETAHEIISGEWGLCLWLQERGRERSEEARVKARRDDVAGRVESRPSHIRALKRDFGGGVARAISAAIYRRNRAL